MSSALLPRPQFELPRMTGKLILLLQKKLVKIVSWCFCGRTISFRSRKHFRALPRSSADVGFTSADPTSFHLHKTVFLGGVWRCSAGSAAKFPPPKLPPGTGSISAMKSDFTRHVSGRQGSMQGTGWLRWRRARRSFQRGHPRRRRTVPPAPSVRRLRPAFFRQGLFLEVKLVEKSTFTESIRWNLEI